MCLAKLRALARAPIAPIALAALPAGFAQSPVLTFMPNSSVNLYQVNGDCDWAAWSAAINNKTPTCKPTVSQTATNGDQPITATYNGSMTQAGSLITVQH